MNGSRILVWLSQAGSVHEAWQWMRKSRSDRKSLRRAWTSVSQMDITYLLFRWLCGFSTNSNFYPNLKNNEIEEFFCCELLRK